ncbi:T9SS type A sorting domain-containing protein [Flavobacterium sp.]|uniref:T9SS type A sorting domain-containing protein n=1 Tax=Flavobacterium sp. TaxID=239 RepID=UPI003752B736
MKKTIILFYLFLSLAQSAFSQNTFFQVKLNPNFYQVVGDSDVYFNEINDAGFNQIINNNGGYIQPIQITFKFSDEYLMSFISVRSIPSMASYATTLYNQLLAYSIVVNSISYNTTQSDFGNSIEGFASDRLKMNLVNSGNGSYLTTDNNIVQTNNSQLNTIFQNFNVDKYENNYIRCNCIINDLKIALQNIPEVVANTLNVPITGAYLNNYEFKTNKTSVYPNPFYTSLTIETNKPIINYFIYDSLGNEVVTSSSKNDLDIKLKELSSGFYLLNLLFDNGQSEIKKIIKK